MGREASTLYAMSKTSLILRADDIGSATGANDAILAACDAGVIKNVSILVPGPAFADAAEKLRGRDELCLGLHVVLNAEWVEPAVRWGPVLPASQVPSLMEAETGFFTPTPIHLHQRGFSVAEAIAEAEAQLAKARAAGLTITYLDEHMGVGWLPGLRSELAALAKRENLIDAIALNPAYLPFNAPPDSDAAALASALLDAAASVEPGIYLVVTHPARLSSETERFYPPDGKPGQVAAEREREFQALTLPAFAEGLKERNVCCIRYDEVRS